MKDSMALGRLAVVTDSGFSLAEAREMVGYDGPVALDRDGCSSPSQLWAQARLARFEERSGKRTRFRRRWWRRIAIVQVGGYYIVCLLTYLSPFGELFDGMCLKLPWPTELLVSPSLLPLVLFILLLAWPAGRHPEDNREEEARLCLTLALDLERGMRSSTSALSLSTRVGSRGVLDRIGSLWESRRLGKALVLWAGMAEWALDLQHERREARAFLVLFFLLTLSAMVYGSAIVLPLTQTVGDLG